MQLINKCNKCFLFLFVTDLFDKYAWAVFLKEMKGAALFDAFQSALDDSKRKPKKKYVSTKAVKFITCLLKRGWMAIT